MSEVVYIFFAGIALSASFIYLWLGITKKGTITDLLSGLFAAAAGIYYLLIGIGGIPVELVLFFATSMFVLFPWYFGYKSGFIKPRILWLISSLGLGYYASVLLTLDFEFSQSAYLFSYSVYILSALYAVASTRSIRNKKQHPAGPFIVLTLYYVVFVFEEILYNTFGLQLPWRRLVNFNYLDLFPMVLIAFKIFLTAYNQMVKSKLEGSLAIYRSNLKVILNQAERFVLTLDLNGRILFANRYFSTNFKSNGPLDQTAFTDLLCQGDREAFQNAVFRSEGLTGKIVACLQGPDTTYTVAWSYVKLMGSKGDSNNRITLFGADISDQKKIEEDLSKAYEDLEALKDKLQAENIQLRNEDNLLGRQGAIVGASPNFNYVLNRIEDVALLDVPVLLEGETGVGKELFASAIRAKSSRRSEAFIKINCSAIPENLLESELFGYEKGAFTGAEKLKRGMFELADGGTLFLDEIGDLPMSLQPKLLRVLQEGEIKRLGSEQTRKINVRLITATNLSLQKQVELGEFRSDLFYRLNVFPITIPPLRKRKSDIPLLINAFIETFNKKYNKQVSEISEGLMEELTHYSWPGNIRQLRNIIERAVITSSGNLLKLTDPLPLKADSTTSTKKDRYANTKLGSLEDFERNHITRVLKHCDWRISGKKGAAEILNLPASTLRSKMKKLGIHSPSKSL